MNEFSQLPEWLRYAMFFTSVMLVLGGAWLGWRAADKDFDDFMNGR